MDSRNIFYVYVLFRPWDGSPFYIGKGTGSRWRHHERQGTKHYNRRLENIVRRARTSGVDIPKVKIRRGLTEAQAFEVEIALIAAIGRDALGPLVNLTSGGDGMRNPSEVSRAKMSIARRARITTDETRAKISAAGRGRIHTNETKEKIGAASRGKPRSDATRLKLRLANLGKKYGSRSDAARANISSALCGHPCSQDTKNKISASAKANWANPKHRKKMLAAYSRAKVGKSNQLQLNLPLPSR